MRAISPLLALGAAALGAVLLLLLAGPAAAAAPGAGAEGYVERMSCRLLEVELKTSVNAYKGTYAGKTVTLTGKVKNTGAHPMEHVAVGFHLPGDGALCRTRATLYPNPRTQEVRFHTDSGANVYWESFTLGAGKWRKFELKAEVSAALAEAGGELDIVAVGYRTDAHCTTVTPPVKVRTLVVVGLSKKVGRVGCGGTDWSRPVDGSAIVQLSRAYLPLVPIIHAHRSQSTRWGPAGSRPTPTTPSAPRTWTGRTRCGRWRWRPRISGAARRARSW